jgi:hypothetical protein
MHGLLMSYNLRFIHNNRGVVKKMSMMKTILTSDGVIIEERQIARLKKEIDYMNEELQYRQDKLKKLRK